MRSRLLIVLALLVVWFGAVAARLYELQVERHDDFRRKAERQQLIETTYHSPRGTIYDARGRALAVSMNVDSAFGVPAKMGDVETLLDNLAGVPGVRQAPLRKALAGGQRWVWIARKLDPPQARDLAARELPGVDFLEESKRYYPQGGSAAAVLGFVGVDDQGLEGLEARYDRVLAGRAVERTLLVDARSGTLQSPELSFHEAPPGDDLELTIDSSLQYMVERELERAVTEHSAEGGAALLLDPRSGAVLAMASLPTFDPNRFTTYSKKRWRNRVVGNAYEPGSTFKIVTAAAALETNRVDPMDVFDCEMGATTVNGVRIRDHKPFGELTFREVIANSSNVGAIKLGLTVGAEALRAQTLAFGFGAPTGIDLPGENGGIVHPPALWRGQGTAYISFGQMVSVTPLQLGLAFAAVANGGDLYKPYVVAASRGRDGRRVETRPEKTGRPISATTARTLERMLEAVVEEGTGKAAAVPGYRVAGKTGTAQMARREGGGYSSDRHVASFAGFAPARAPEVLGVVVIYEPQGKIHGGEVAAPVFASILSQALPYLGVRPERELPPPPATRVAAAAPLAPATAAAGTLPDLTGLTARQAVKRSAALGLQPALEGRGVVIAQTPGPGTPLPATGGRVLLTLDSGSGR